MRSKSEMNWDLQGSMHTSARCMRGHVAYWDEVRKNLRAHVATFGPPTWFLTLNPAEKEWPEVLERYQQVELNFGPDQYLFSQAYPEVTKDNLNDFIAKDPFFFARIFQQRVSGYMKKGSSVPW